jgi:hypothetical protein
MKYRHLHKVDAVPQQFVASTSHSIQPSQELPITGREIFPETVVTDEVAVATDSVAPMNSSLPETTEPVQMKSVEKVIPLVNPNSENSPLKRDWSLLIGLFFIGGGLLALYLCAFVFPWSGINFLLIIFFDLFLLYAAWRLISTGVAYFRARFGAKRNYKES